MNRDFVVTRRNPNKKNFNICIRSSKIIERFYFHLHFRSWNVNCKYSLHEMQVFNEAK